MTTQTDNSAVAELVENITKSIVESRDALIAGRDAQLAAEVAPLNVEREALTAEHAAIAKAARDLRDCSCPPVRAKRSAKRMRSRLPASTKRRQ